MKTALIFIGLLIGFFSLSGNADVRAEAIVGQAAPDFSLTDTHGQAHTLSAQRGKFVVLEWTNYECPFVRKHYGSGNMQKLQKQYAGRGVVWFSVNSSVPGKQGNFTSEKWNELIGEMGAAPAAVLLDPDGEAGKLYGAQTTPHMFVVNPDGVLIYQGAIDDIPGTDPSDIPKAKNFVQAALDEAMAGKPVSVPAAKSYGCSVKY